MDCGFSLHFIYFYEPKTAFDVVKFRNDFKSALSKYKEPKCLSLK